MKIFIVCLNKQVALSIAKEIVNKNDDLSIAPMFTTDGDIVPANENYEVHMEANVANLSYKNNALLFIVTNQYISTGITTDDFYNNDICIMTVEEYNIIPESTFNKHDILVVWVDTKITKSINKNDLIEIGYLTDSLENKRYLYFIDEEEFIADTILDYLLADEDRRQVIFEQNS